MSSANSPAMPSSSAAEQCRLMKKELLEKVDILSRALPPNTLDKLIDDLGGPENVSEVKKNKAKRYTVYTFLISTIKVYIYNIIAWYIIVIQENV